MLSDYKSADLLFCYHASHVKDTKHSSSFFLHTLKLCPWCLRLQQGRTRKRRGLKQEKGGKRMYYHSAVILSVLMS